MEFNLKKKTNIPNEESSFLKNHHSLWRKDLKDRNENFFMLYKDFANFLPELTTGALKLYLFYGFNAKNETGESWYSIDTIAEKLGTTSRSINTWNAELESLGLIYRVSENRSSKVTYLVPYTSQIIFSDVNVEKFMNDYRNNPNITKFIGEINQIYHVFQWRKNKAVTEKDVYDKPLNLLSIELLKTYDFNNSKDNTKRTYMVFDLSKYSQFDGEIEDEYMSGSTPIFTFEETYKDKSLKGFKVKGVVVNTKVDLLDKKQLKLVLDELDDSADLQYYTKVKMNATKENNEAQGED